MLTGFKTGNFGEDLNKVNIFSWFSWGLSSNLMPNQHFCIKQKTPHRRGFG